MAGADEMLAVAASRQDELAVPGQSPRPRRKLAVLACMDARMDLFLMLGLARGDAHIIRNAGGLVTDDALRSLVVSQRLLGTEEIVVLMHDGCGLHGAAEEHLGAFADLEATLRSGLARLRSSPELPARDRIRGFIFDPESGALREVMGPSG
jgi:carbonic anhydrase